MQRKFMSKLLVCLALVILTATLPVRAQYADYKESTGPQLMFRLMFDKDSFGCVVPENGDTSVYMSQLATVKVQGQSVILDRDRRIDSDGLLVNDTLYRFSEVTNITIERQEAYTVLSFYSRDDSVGRTRRGNIIDPSGSIVVQEEDFVRGSVFSLTGYVKIYGEVNKNVISLFGDIKVGDSAVVRGDVVTVTGKIQLSGDAAVYGSVRSGSDDRIGRRHRYRRFRNVYDDYFDFSCSDKFCGYNRVDGLSLGMMVKFADPDSLLPSVWAGGGYAFESERWRYELGLEQTLLRHTALAVGGKAYRLLASDDDWLLSTADNTCFAIMVREDYKDYYEAEGGALWFRASPVHDLDIETGFRYEETKWLDAQPNLWSLFAGEDKFAANFSSVDSASRAVGIGRIDSGVNASLYGKVSYDTRDSHDPFYRSSWLANAVLEKSSPGLDSDFDYTRYRLSAARYQAVTRRTMLILRGTYGGSDGVLPMHRRFYLGGQGTLYGYEHKEYSGSYFWMANSEYRIDFPHSDLAASLIWDVGQTAETSNFGNSEVKHSLGVSLYVGNDFQIGLAKRLDRSYDDNPKLFARMSFSVNLD